METECTKQKTKTRAEIFFEQFSEIMKEDSLIEKFWFGL